MGILNTISQKMTLKRRMIALLLCIILVLLTIFSLTFRDKLGLNLFTRFLTYDNETANVTFAHNARSEDLFVALDFKLLACAETSLQLFSGTGSTLFQTQVSMENPAVGSNGKQAVVYDAGGHSLYVISKDKVAFPLELTEDQYILSATINEAGWVAVTTKEDGYKGVVNIYDANYELFGSIRLSSHYLRNAIVTPDCSGLYALSTTQSLGNYESRLLYYSFDQYRPVDEAEGTEEELVLLPPTIPDPNKPITEQEEPIPEETTPSAEEPVSQVALGNSAVLSMTATDNCCWVLAEDALYIFLSSGELSQKYDFAGKYLKRASLNGTDFATLLLSQSATGNTGTLVTVDNEGTAIATKEFEEPIVDLTAAGRYLAILTPNGLQVFGKNLDEISSSNMVQGVQSINLFPDGTLAQIMDENIRLYIP